MSNSRDIADSAATINFIDTVSSNVQTQLNAKGVGSVTSVGGTGSVSGLTLTGTVTGSGNLTLGGTLDDINLASGVTGTLPVANGGTGATTLTANNVLLGNGTSAPLAIAPSTSGNVLTSNGTTWQSTAPAGGGAWELITSATASNSSTVDIEWANGSYIALKIIIEGVRVSTNNGQLLSRFKFGSYVTSSKYNYAQFRADNSSGSWGSENGTNQSSYKVIGAIGNGTMNSASSEIFIFNAGSTSLRKYVQHDGTADTYNSGDNQYVYRYIGSCLIQGSTEISTQMTGMRFYTNSGTLVSGNFRLYGIKNS